MVPPAAVDGLAAAWVGAAWAGVAPPAAGVAPAGAAAGAVVGLAGALVEAAGVWLAPPPQAARRLIAPTPSTLVRKPRRVAVVSTPLAFVAEAMRAASWRRRRLCRIELDKPFVKELKAQVFVLLDRRRSGVLLHPTSLPGDYGIGDLGPSAFAFLQYLADAGQSLWQVLPLNPTGYGDSPYASPSAFAGNVLLVSPELLVGQGLLVESDLTEFAGLSREHVDFPSLLPLKTRLLRTAFERGRDALRPRLDAFRTAQAAWIEDFALFSALKDELGNAWTEWEGPLRHRHADALARARDQLAERIEYYAFCQLLFADQWAAVRARAQSLGIGIIGDIPIFVAHDSSDVWANQHLFKLDDRGLPVVVAGVPPDYFSATGQRWGNPLYDWDAMAREGYRWWIERFRQLLASVNLVRIDHFRGFEAAWEVDAAASTAIDGTWVKGPGDAVFKAIAASLGGGQPPVIAEDLGMITDDVRTLLDSTRFPGMKVLQFAFGGGPDNPYLPHNYRDPNCVVYTGTHDNDTSRGWFANAPAPEQESVRRYLGTPGSDIAADLIRVALASTANTAILPLQDLLDLDSDARMNTPGAAESNWTWRFRADQLDARHAASLAELTTTYGRSQTDQ
jgi:4-alpha-glucanotransferase